MSKLLTTRRGHDSEDDYSDSGGEDTRSYISTEIEVEDDSFDEKEETDSEFETEYSEEEEESDSELEEEEEIEIETETEQEEKKKEEYTTPVQVQEQVVEEIKGDEEDDNTHDTPNIPVEELDYEATKEKRIQEHREYRRKLAEDPSFVPNVGLFWSHDDRYREDSLGNETRSSTTATPDNITKTEPYFNPHHTTNNNHNYDRSMDPLMYKKWDHSGYEELLRLDEEDERRKREMIESGEDNNRRYHNKFAQRGRGNRGGRGGYQNNGQRYSNFNSNYNRNRNNYNKSNHGAEEWPELSTNETTTIVGNNAWATATPEALQEHGASCQWGILVDIDTPVATTSETTTPNVGTTSEATTPKVGTTSEVTTPKVGTPRPLTKPIDVKFAELVDVSPLSSLAPTVNAWESVDRVEEKETLGNAATTTTTITTTVSIMADESDGWGTPDPAATSDWAEAKKPEWNTNEKTQWNNDNSSWNAPTQNGWNNTTKSAEKEAKVAKTTSNWDSNVTESLGSWGTPTDQQQSQPVESVEMVPTNSNVSSLGWVPEVDAVAEESDDKKAKTTTTLNQCMNADKDPTVQQQQNIPTEEKASTSWTQMSNNHAAIPEKSFNRNNYRKNNNWDSSSNDRSFSPRSRNYNESGRNNWKQQNSSEDRSNWKQQKYTASSPIVQKQQQEAWNPAAESNGWANTTPTTTQDNGWGAANTTTESKDWNDAKPTSSAVESSGWGEVAATTTENTASWGTTNFDVKDVSASAAAIAAAAAAASIESSWSASPAATTESFSSGWVEPIEEKPKQNGWTSEPVRSNGWSTNQSSNSTNWNADKKANNQARYNNNNPPPARKGRGYLSQKLESPTVEEPKDEVYHSHDDEDSDVEIILEADEEPDWVKNEEILGMTAPGDDDEETPTPASPKKQNYRNYDSSSPQLEYNYDTRNNYHHKPRRNFDENWRQRDNEDMEDTTRVPMYYPQPHHQMNGGGNITYLPMIPNGPNGSSMYAIPFPMGSPVAGSVSPNSANGGDSSPHINHNSQKFYPPMVNGPNGLQLPPGYEANGMVYYGMDPSAMYAPQPYYYYAPMPATNGPPMFSPYEDKRTSPKIVEEEEDGWGPSPDVEGEEQWNNNKKSVPVSQPSATTYNSSYYVYSQQQNNY